ncbi:hypothetical protein [Bacteroides pyogenes]|uniref:hypothetical protein n=1 Tax=Bacteroides pyogenes TaxID=310300 RepID=UPI003F9F5034|nr:hypothetical protein [Proteiniphilum sp.]
MLQIIFLVIGLCIIVLALSFAFKRYARLILWSSAITLFAGTLLLVGIGVINPIDGDNSGSTTFWGTIITLISGAALAFCAEMLKEGNKGKIKVQNGNVTETSIFGGQTVANEGAVVLTGMLNTELAVKVFAKAIEAGYMSEKGSHYKWNDSKVLLAYMCGRIYCGDKPEYSETDEKSYWKFGRMGVFPDTELSNLFEMPDLGQSRSNRKDLAVPAKSKEIDKFFE